MRPVPVLVRRDVRQTQVGRQVHYASVALPQRGDGRRGRGVRVGDDRGVDVHAIQVQFRDRQRHAVTRVEVVQAPPYLGAPGDRDQLEAGMAPEQVRRKRTGEAGCAGDKHAW